ncbi:hypothetical protein HPP92_000416 [Vanilla planifolia]|uniref:Uncharacterized protein n=1 Tax=Vanilla planifolia TaxID=51239 RepID=A0A835RY24_VANPL|nr:hypothetical protein HPP92_000416 [Vanilla planifolia]
MLSLQTDVRQQHQLPPAPSPSQVQKIFGSGSFSSAAGIGFNRGILGSCGDRLEETALSLQTVDASCDIKPLQLVKQIEVDDDVHLALAHQNYKSGNYKQALEHCNMIYEKNPLRRDNLLLLGAIYYQLHDYDTCIAKNEEALAIDPHFPECYGNMANAWKEQGNIDLAIHYYQVALEVCCYSLCNRLNFILNYWEIRMTVVKC